MTIRWPSGEKATARIGALCPLSVSSSRPLAASHTLAVLSKLPVTMRRPSGEKATEQTPPTVPRESEQLPPAGCLPHLGRLIVTAGDNPLAVRGKGHGINPTAVPLKRKQFAARWLPPTPWQSHPNCR